MLCEMVRRRPRERQKLSAVKLDRLRLRSPGCGKRKKTASGLSGQGLIPISGGSSSTQGSRAGRLHARYSTISR